MIFNRFSEVLKLYQKAHSIIEKADSFIETTDSPVQNTDNFIENAESFIEKVDSFIEKSKASLKNPIALSLNLAAILKKVDNITGKANCFPANCYIKMLNTSLKNPIT